LRDQLKRLEELQKHDAKISELTEQQDAIPKKIEATENDLARVEGLLATERSQLDDARKYLNEQKNLLEMENVQMANARHKLSQAKAVRESSAAQREIEHTRDMAQSRENEIKKLIEAIAVKERILEERAAEVKTLRDSIAADQNAAREKVDGLQVQVDKLKQEREEITKQIPANVLKRYSVIRTRKGQAISAVRNGTCSACNMNIPPQLFNTLRRANTIESCPYCLRIIYWEDILKPADSEKSEGGTDQESGGDATAGGKAAAGGD